MLHVSAHLLLLLYQHYFFCSDCSTTGPPTVPVTTTSTTCHKCSSLEETVTNGTGLRTRKCHYLTETEVPSVRGCDNETCECVKGLFYDGEKCVHGKDCRCYLKVKGGVLEAGEVFKKDCIIYQCILNSIVRKDLTSDCPPVGACTSALVKDSENECCYVS